MTIEQIDKIFAYHAPNGKQNQAYAYIREMARLLAGAVQLSCPESREKSLAITNIQQAVMWANASIALNESEAL